MDNVEKLLHSLHNKLDALRDEVKKADAPLDRGLEKYIIHPIYTPVVVVALAVLCLYVGAKIF